METPSSPRADNDQQLAADLTHWTQVLTAARDDADAQEKLAPVGYGPVALDAILTEVDEARTAYQARTAAKAAAGGSFKKEGAEATAARKAHADFRVIARAEYDDDEEAQTALGLNGRQPRALGTFLTHAQSGYTAAKGEPYQTVLAERGYTPERLDALLADLVVLLKADRDSTAAGSTAKKSTATRDDEAKEARGAFDKFRSIARRVLPQDLRDRIGLG